MYGKNLCLGQSALLATLWLVCCDSKAEKKNSLYLHCQKILMRNSKCGPIFFLVFSLLTVFVDLTKVPTSLWNTIDVINFLFINSWLTFYKIQMLFISSRILSNTWFCYTFFPQHLCSCNKGYFLLVHQFYANIWLRTNWYPFFNRTYRCPWPTNFLITS